MKESVERGMQESPNQEKQAEFVGAETDWVYAEDPADEKKSRFATMSPQRKLNSKNNKDIQNNKALAERNEGTDLPDFVKENGNSENDPPERSGTLYKRAHAGISWVKTNKKKAAAIAACILGLAVSVLIVWFIYQKEPVNNAQVQPVKEQQEETVPDGIPGSIVREQLLDWEESNQFAIIVCTDALLRDEVSFDINYMKYLTNEESVVYTRELKARKDEQEADNDENNTEPLNETSIESSATGNVTPNYIVSAGENGTDIDENEDETKVYDGDTMHCPLKGINYGNCFELAYVQRFSGGFQVYGSLLDENLTYEGMDRDGNPANILAMAKTNPWDETTGIPINDEEYFSAYDLCDMEGNTIGVVYVTIPETDD